MRQLGAGKPAADGRADAATRRRATLTPSDTRCQDPSRRVSTKSAALIAHLPGPDLEAGSAAALRERQLTKPPGALGRLEELAGWLATWQGRHPPSLRHPRTVVFAGNHGVASRGVSAYPAAVTAQMVQNFIAGGAAVNQLCRIDRRRSARL